MRGTQLRDADLTSGVTRLGSACGVLQTQAAILKDPTHASKGRVASWAPCTVQRGGGAGLNEEPEGLKLGGVGGKTGGMVLGEGESQYDLNQLRQGTDKFLRATFHQPSRLPAGPKKGSTGPSVVEACLQGVAPGLHCLGSLSQGTCKLSHLDLGRGRPSAGV